MPENNGWIDFRALCKSVDFEEILKIYGAELKLKGEKAQGRCPLPQHKAGSRSPSFSANLPRGIWQCFGCGGKGNVLDFVATMEGLDPRNGKDIRRAAEILQQTVGVPTSSELSPRKAYTRLAEATTGQGPVQSSQRVVVNAPLDFELRELDPGHPYLSERGLTAATVETFGLGYCNRGMFKGRIAIPIHDRKGQLLGYAGRLTNDHAITREKPKYLLPARREHNGILHEFHKSDLLYNLHRVGKKVSDLIIVEGFPSVWWLHQHGFKNVVALMGSDCSLKQAQLICDRLEPAGRIWIMPDGDPAGVQCAESLLKQLSPFRWVRWSKLKDDEQPTDCGIQDLEAMLTF